MRLVRSLDQLPHGSTVAEAMVLSPGAITGAVAYRNDAGAERIRVYGPGCQHKTLDEAIQGLPRGLVVWGEGTAPDAATQPGGRTRAALELLDRDPSLSAHAAAKRVGVHVSAVYRAMQRAARPACECCGRRLPA